MSMIPFGGSLMNQACHRAAIIARRPAAVSDTACEPGELERVQRRQDVGDRDVVQTVPGTDAGLGQAGEFWQAERGQAGTEQVTSAFPT
ncbi:hypothetical protein [Streptomyces sp. NBC_01538]|uniref:hypothetical protein n=1 Tax=Streptomyces sp. NBC_01538 TaxID=2903897 RepID=UPI00386F21E4